MERVGLEPIAPIWRRSAQGRAANPHSCRGRKSYRGGNNTGCETASDSLASGTESSPISTVIREKDLRRQVLPALMSVGCGLLLFYLGFIESTGVREFEHAKFVGIYLFLFFNRIEYYWAARRAGAPLARLLARREWLGFVVTVGARFGYLLRGQPAHFDDRLAHLCDWLGVLLFNRTSARLFFLDAPRSACERRRHARRALPALAQYQDREMGPRE